LLVIDARELLTSTAASWGPQLGEVHFKVWRALITLHVARANLLTARDRAGSGSFSRIVWGANSTRGGIDTRRLLGAMIDLRQARFTVPGYDLVNERPALGVSDTNLLVRLYVDEQVLRTYEQAEARRNETPEQRRERLATAGRAVRARQGSGTLGSQLDEANTGLRIVRRRPPDSPLNRPYGGVHEQQLTLAA
jgi:hypothetical protein